MQNIIEQLLKDVREKKLSDLRDITTSIDPNSSNGFLILVTTPKLYLKNSGVHDGAEYQKLMQDPDNMRSFHRGKPHAQEEIGKRIARNEERKNNYNPYSNYGIFNKEDQFIGMIALASLDDKSNAEIVYIIDKEYWKQGYGKEATYALIYGLLPNLVANNYMLKTSEGNYSPEKIEATARIDNKASRKILKKIGFTAQERNFFANYDQDNLRKKYKIEVSQVLQVSQTLINTLNSEQLINSSTHTIIAQDCSTIPTSPATIPSNIKSTQSTAYQGY